MSKKLCVYLMAFPEAPELVEAAVAGGADLIDSASRSPTRSPTGR